MIYHNIPRTSKFIIFYIFIEILKNNITQGKHEGKAIAQFKRTFNKEPLFVSSGSLALYYTIKKINPKVMWLPQYSCISLTRAAKSAGYEPRYYRSSEAEFIEDTDVFNTGDMVVIVNTFGKIFSNSFEIKQLEMRGVDVLEDFTHGYDLESGIRAKYGVASMGYTKLINATGMGVIVGFKKEEGFEYGDYSFSNSIILSKPSNLDFLFLNYALKNLQKKINERKRLYDFYYRGLIGIKKENLLYSKFEKNEIPYRLVIQVNNSDKLISNMLSNKIVVDNPVWNEDFLSKIDIRYKNLVSLPFYEGMKLNHIKTVLRNLK